MQKGLVSEMSNSFEESYLGQLRKNIGQKRIIVPGVRAVIRDSKRRVLLIHRRDTGRWGMPAGAVEIEILLWIH